MSTPSSCAIASAPAIPAGVSIKICTIVASSSAGFSAAAGVGRMPSCGTIASCERWPRGANRHALLTVRASSTDSIRGATMPCAPQSSSRPIAPYSRSGTRTNGVMPRSPAVAQSRAATSRGMVECSRSTMMLWYPQLCAMRTTSAVRLLRMPSISVSSPLRSRSRNGLRREASMIVILFLTPSQGSVALLVPVRAGMRFRCAEEDVHQIAVIRDLLSRPGQRDGACPHHRRVLCERQPEPYVLLDHQDSRAGLVHRHDAAGDEGQAARVEAQCRLVQQHDLGFEHQRAGELDHAPLSTGQGTGGDVGTLGEQREHLRELLIARLDVLAAPADDHRSASRSEDSAYRLQDGRFARPVGPDDAGDAAVGDVQVDAAQDVEAAIPGPQTLYPDHAVDSAGASATSSPR